MSGFAKHTVSFPAEGGVELSAWLFIPGGSGPFPGITMAHGFGGTKYHGLEVFAEAFANAGFAVLLHDHRGFGDSGGEPRQDVNPWQQIADWRRAISYLQDRPEVDDSRIGLWGTSYAGGHAIVLGATDRRVKAVVSQVPATDGFSLSQRKVPPDAVAKLEKMFGEDERARLRGEPGKTQAIVSDDPATPAAFRDPDAVAFYLQPVPAGVWENKLTIASNRWSRMYAPGEYVDRVSPTPMLMLVAENDTVALTDLALKAYETALQPKQLLITKGGHFDPYLREFSVASNAAVEWFEAHLG